MLSSQIRERLQQLNRQSLPAAARASTSRPVSLSTGYEVKSEVGCHWQVRQSIDELWPHWKSISPSARTHVRSSAANDQLHADLRVLADSFPHRVSYLDLETCGFAGSMIFLVGLMHWYENEFVLTQMWARNYAEEGPLLDSLLKQLEACDVIVSFNGKSFDWPQVRDRTMLHRLRSHDATATNRSAATSGTTPDSMSDQFVHCDLLHHARRRWKHRLPNCKLQTLEQFVCGRYRMGDIPGRDIPAAYHHYVRSGETWQVQSILEHNALDLVTLLQLTINLTTTKGWPKGADATLPQLGSKSEIRISKP